MSVKKAKNENNLEDMTRTTFINTAEDKDFIKQLEVSKKTPPSLRILHGQNQGKKYSLVNTSNIIGREATCEIWIDDPGASRRHAEIIIEQDGAICIIRDLGSRNGIHVNNQAVKEATLRHADVVRIGKTTFRFNGKGSIDQVLEENLINSANVDALTGLANKKFINESLDQEIKIIETNNQKMSLLLFDIDHFKSINDNFGHQAGDYVLSTIPKILDEKIIPSLCTFGRWGGEEFVVIYPDHNLHSAIQLGEKLRSMIESFHFKFESQDINVTISVGCVEHKTGMSAADLFKQSDIAMYKAKKSGRNRVCSNA